MTAKNRIKFFMGILIVLMLVGALVLYLNVSMSTLRTNRAQLRSDSITVGTDYAGLVVNQFVEESDKITKGQKLFQIKSAQLNAEITNGDTEVDSLPFTVNEDNDILIEAREDGVIQKIFYRNGAYAPVGSILANIDTVNSLYVEAKYDLSPPYYARIKKGSTMNVTLPDNTKLDALVYNIALVSRGEGVDTVIKARLQSPDLADFRFSVGTPVQGSLQLTSETWYQGVTDFVRNLLRPKGG